MRVKNISDIKELDIMTQMGIWCISLKTASFSCHCLFTHFVYFCRLNAIILNNINNNNNGSFSSFKVFKSQFSLTTWKTRRQYLKMINENHCWEYTKLQFAIFLKNLLFYKFIANFLLTNDNRVLWKKRVFVYFVETKNQN